MYSQWMQQNPQLMQQAMQRYGGEPQQAPVTAPPPTQQQQAPQAQPLQAPQQHASAPADDSASRIASLIKARQGGDSGGGIGQYAGLIAALL